MTILSPAGGVMDEHGQVLGHNNDIAGLLPLFAQEFPRRTASYFVQHIEEKHEEAHEAAAAAAQAIGANAHGHLPLNHHVNLTHSQHRKKFSVMGTLG